MVSDLIEDVLVRRLTFADAPDLYRLIDESREGLRNLLWVASATQTSTEAFIAQKAITDDIVYCLSSQGAIAGILELRNKGATQELGYWLGTAYRGKGIMRFAVHQLVAIASLWTPVTAHIRTTNDASRSVLTSAGLVETHQEIWEQESWSHFSTQQPIISS
jgi:RimJ/RimL family protein N-acetyltransferase